MYSEILEGKKNNLNFTSQVVIKSDVFYLGNGESEKVLHMMNFSD